VCLYQQGTCSVARCCVGGDLQAIRTYLSSYSPAAGMATVNIPTRLPTTDQDQTAVSAGQLTTEARHEMEEQGKKHGILIHNPQTLYCKTGTCLGKVTTLRLSTCLPATYGVSYRAMPQFTTLHCFDAMLWKTNNSHGFPLLKKHTCLTLGQLQVGLHKGSFCTETPR
jgi:hypothetical protein